MTTVWPEVRDMEANLLGRVKVTDSYEKPYYHHAYWRFVLTPKEGDPQYEVHTMDLTVSEFRIGGRSDRWFGFQTDKSLDELKQIACFVPSGGTKP